MSDSIIQVQNLSKSYILKYSQKERYTALRDVISNKVKSYFSPSKKNQRRQETFLALNDVSFEVNEGDRVGIIGRNGAGKSTLLKVLSRIVSPSKGQVILNGRVSSLLEVGTGFHPELTGRENIFLNGSILGMSRSEIIRKFDEIVSFAEVDKFLDTPVKRYSSGMYVRLAFAVAAHLEPEILIVDEVLAVGDAQFQKKCLGKMQDISEAGRTILFVSHNLQAVQKLCNTGILLHKGKVSAKGNIAGVISSYLDPADSSNYIFNIRLPENHNEINAYASQVKIEDEFGNHSSEIPVGVKWKVRVSFRINKATEHFIVALGIVTSYDLPVQTSWSVPELIREGEYEAIFSNPDLLLTSGQYKLVVGLSTYERAIHYVENAAWLTISDAVSQEMDIRILNTKSGLVLNPMNIMIEKK